MILSNKIALIDNKKSQLLNTNYRRLAEITGVPKSTISRVLRQESQLREELWQRRKYQLPNIEGEVRRLVKKLGRNDFKATDGWLSQWKARHIIKSKKAHCEKGSADNENAEQWKTTKILTFLENFCADDI
ncbi:hypothetical protein RF11_14684 [Thelohanellus kitauei]|uniref:HTH CENPB-type domain-containing protein n=1 Tax=Thelohanellus kitauei TaxID=669202 RepID=A0A0C2JNY0_THEKT|nr:hypothetical protein RF11_14684 [Thelohanellus kitauei]